MKKSNKDNIISPPQSDRAILMVCISIALVFWLLVKLSQTFKTDREIDINFKISEGKTFVETPPDKIYATIKGNGWDLISHYFYQPKTSISIDLPNDPTYTVNGSSMKSKIARKMPNLEVVEVSFEYIFLNMEAEETKKVPIQFKPELNFDGQFHLKDSIRIEPDSVVIWGPSSLLEPILYWPAQELKLDKVRTNLNPIVQLVESSNNQLRLQPKSIEAVIVVEQFTEKSMFAPITIKNAPDSLAVFPDQVKVSCIVGLSKYKALDQHDFVLEVDLKNIPLNTEDNTLPISIAKQPDYVRGVKLSNQSVEFFFVKSSIEAVDSLGLETEIEH